MVYYSRYITGMKKVVGGVSLLQLVLSWQSWAYHDVKSQWTQVLPCSSLARSLWLKMIGVSLTLTKCTPWVLVIINPCPFGFTSDFKCLTFIYLVESWMSKLTHTEACFFPQVWLNLGDRWSTRQVRSLHTRQHKVHSGEVWWNLYCLCVISAWSSQDNHFWSRVVVCRSLLGATARVSRDSLDSQFGLSPPDGWPNRESQLNSRRYA
jgi:hypothetical protein